MRLNSSNSLGFLLCGFCVLLSLPLAGQQDGHPPKTKRTPPTIYPKISVLWDKVVLEQWPATLELVNYSGDLEQVEPGQCIRVGVVANGDDASKLLSSSRYSYTFEFRGESSLSQNEPPSAIKQLKPEGGDLVTEALAAANIKNPLPTMASIAALQNGWCAPANVQSGTLNVDVSVSGNGLEKKLERKSVPVKTFAAAREVVPFNTIDAVGTWMQRYYEQPRPAFVLPAIRIVAADDKARSLLNMMQFMVSVLKSNPVAAVELKEQLPDASQVAKIYGIYVLGQAGYQIDELLQGFEEVARAGFKKSLPDPYNFSPGQMLFQQQDMLWAIFFASGDRRPVEAVASMLTWKKDYEALEEVRKAHEKDPSRKTELNPTLVKGAAYMSAGWSLGSLSRTNSLVKDYLQALQQSPEFPQTAKIELETLHTNPAFARKSGSH